ncbi:MAG: EamA family transporter [Acidimicrobiia bacterium]
MSRPRPEHTGAIYVALFVTVLWSSSWILIRWVLDSEELSPVLFAGLRYGLAASVLAGLISSGKRTRGEIRVMTAADWLYLGGLGLVFVSVAQGAQFVAIASQPAATSSLVLSLTPLVVAISSTAALGEAPSFRQLAASAVILIGALTYFSGDLGFTTVGMIASGVGLAANAAASLMGRQANRGRRQSPLVVTGVSMAIGAIALLTVGLATEGMPHLSPRTWSIIAWLALVNTALAFTLWNRSLQILTATESAAINNTMLVQIALLAWIFLGESPGPLDIIGMVLVSVGVYLAQRKPVEATGST